MPRKKSNLNAYSRDALRMRVKRSRESVAEIAVRNAVQRIRTAEIRSRESQEQHDERLRQNRLRARAAQKRRIATFRERQQTSRAIARWAAIAFQVS